MRSVRAYLAGILTLGAALSIAACGREFSTQPSQPSQVQKPLAPSPIGSYTELSDMSAYNATVTFTIQPDQDAYIAIGPHFLYIPAASVCDPTTAGYGVDTWANSCTTISSPLTVTATSSLVNGHPRIDFNTHLRFRPSTSSVYDVMLYLRSETGSTGSTIKWCPDSGTNCVNETGWTVGVDLGTRFDPQGRYLYRKIQHFSGFVDGAGSDGVCDANDPTDPDCSGGGL